MKPFNVNLGGVCDVELRNNNAGYLTQRSIKKLQELIVEYYKQDDIKYACIINEAFSILFENAKRYRDGVGRRLTIDESKKLYGLHFTQKHDGKMRSMISVSSDCTHNKRCIYRMMCELYICASCYAEALVRMRKGLAQCLFFNYILFTTQLIPREIIPLINATKCRIEAFGDAANETHAHNYVNIAYENHDTRFTAFTKNPDFYDTVFKKFGQPSNLHMVGSSIKENEVSDFSRYKFIEKVFTVYTDAFLAEHPEIKINCGSRICIECLLCYTDNKVYFINERKKNVGKKKK